MTLGDKAERRETEPDSVTVGGEGTGEGQHLTLFNRPEYHRLNLRPGQAYARIDHHVGGRLVGSLAGAIDSGQFVSGFSAPFGGPDLVRDSETVTNIFGLLSRALDWAGARGISTIRIKAKPSFYSSSEEAVQFTLFNLGFSVEACELNFHIDLVGMSSIEEYVKRLKPAARRALKHGLGEPFALSEALSEEQWAVAYGLLERNRAAKGRRLQLSLGYLLDIRKAFPKWIRMFIFERNNAPCGAALIYRVRPRRELVVYWGDADHELERSPMNAFVQRLVERAIAEGVLSLDVGISSEDGVPNQGLIQFKESVLARPFLRLVFARQV